MQKNELVKDPTTFEVLNVTNKTKIGEWVGKASEITGELTRYRDESISQGQKPFIAFGNALFFEVIGGRNKKCLVNGLGAVGDEYVASATPSSSSCHGPTQDVRGLISNLNAGLVSQLAERVATLEKNNHLLYRHLSFRPSGFGSALEDAAAFGTYADGPIAPNDRSIPRPLVSNMMQMIMRLHTNTHT